MKFPMLKNCWKKSKRMMMYRMYIIPWKNYNDLPFLNS